MVCLFEFKSEFKRFAIFTLGICVLLIFFMAFRPLLAESEEFFAAYMSAMPPEFSLAFGIDINTMFEPIGYYVFVANFMLLAGVIMSCQLALSVLSREKRAGANEFLFTRPLARLFLFGTKLGVGALYTILFGIAYYFTLYIVYTDEIEFGIRLSIVTGFVLTQFVFFGIGALLAVLLRRVRSVPGIATAVGFLAFIMTVLNNTLGADVRILSPMQYFDVGHLAQNGSFEFGYAFLSVLISALLIAAAGYLYHKRDIVL